MIIELAANATAALNYSEMGLSPIALDLGFFKLRWYSLAYIAGILLGWWYLLRLIAQPGSPMAKRHADDLVFWATIGIIGGGRLGYVLFYKPELFETPLEILKLWEGGMSLHGGLIGVLIAIWWVARSNKLDMLRMCDFIAPVAPFGVFFGRLANFVNGELWGRPTDVSWGIIFPATGDGIPRHPSQLYEAGLEGIVPFLVLSWMFWRTDARYYPGRIVGTAAVLYGVARSFVELFRQPDQGLENLPWGLTMGQTLSLPMVLIGLYLIATSAKRRQRVEPIAGSASVA